MREPQRLAFVAVVLLLLGAECARAEDETPATKAAALAEHLGTEDTDARRKAAYALWQLGADARHAAPALADALRDDDEYVRSTAERVLARMDWQRSIGTLVSALPELMHALEDPRVSVRLAAANLIWNAGPVPNVAGGPPPPENLVPALMKALGDTHAGVRANAAAALGNIPAVAGAALPSLRRTLADPDPKVRVWSVRAVCGIDPARGLPWSLALAEDPDATVRTAVMETAGGATEAAADAAFPVLLAGLHDTQADVRVAAVGGLSALRRPAAVSPLMRVLANDAEARVRAVAASALGWIGDLRALPALQAALADTDDAVLMGAVTGVTRMGPEGLAAGTRLLELLEAASAPVRRHVAMSLGMVAPIGPQFVPTLLGRLADEDAGVRAMAASSLSAFAREGAGGPVFRNAAVRGLDDDSREVRQYMLTCLMHMGPDAAPAVPWIVARLEGPDPDGERTALCSTLRRIGPAAAGAVPALKRLAADTDFERIAAAAALASIAEDARDVHGAVQVLINVLADERLRGYGFYALRDVGPPAKRASFILRVWLKHPSALRLLAAGALLRIESGEAPDAVRVLEAGLASDDAGTALRAIDGLGVDARSLEDALVRLARGPGGRWRTGALRALITAGVGSKQVRTLYASLRQDGDAWVRMLATQGLARLEAVAPAASDAR